MLPKGLPSKPCEVEMLNNQQIASLTTKKILFGHQSVGNDIINGIRDLANADPRLKLKIVKSSDPQSIPGPAMVEFNVGENGNPQSKIDSFTAVLDKGMGAQGGIAMFKLCYVDIVSTTDIGKIAAAYHKGVYAWKSKYPSLDIVHVTVPLTAEEPAAKAWIRRLPGRATHAELNVKRNQFNDLIRSKYAGVDPIFDLAEVESTHGDRSRSFFVRGNDRIYTLAPEYTVDGGHLNERGRYMAAQKMLLVCSQLGTRGN